MQVLRLWPTESTLEVRREQQGLRTITLLEPYFKLLSVFFWRFLVQNSYVNRQFNVSICPYTCSSADCVTVSSEQQLGHCHLLSAWALACKRAGSPGAAQRCGPGTVAGEGPGSTGVIRRHQESSNSFFTAQPEGLNRAPVNCFILKECWSRFPDLQCLATKQVLMQERTSICRSLKTDCNTCGINIFGKIISCFQT